MKKLSDSHQCNYSGIGVNGGSYLDAVRNSLDNNERWVPAAASWPFVRFSFNAKAVSFRIVKEVKSINKEDVLISMSKIGYIYFRTADGTSDFGFWNPKISQLLAQLKASGYTLDDSCTKNLRVAKVAFIISLCAGVLAVVLGALAASGVI